jgi:hypothetical protein
VVVVNTIEASVAVVINVAVEAIIFVATASSSSTEQFRSQ